MNYQSDLTVPIWLNLTDLKKGRPCLWNIKNCTYSNEHVGKRLHVVGVAAAVQFREGEKEKTWCLWLMVEPGRRALFRGAPQCVLHPVEDAPPTFGRRTGHCARHYLFRKILALLSCDRRIYVHYYVH